MTNDMEAATNKAVRELMQEIINYSFRGLYFVFYYDHDSRKHVAELRDSENIVRAQATGYSFQTIADVVDTYNQQTTSEGELLKIQLFDALKKD